MPENIRRIILPALRSHVPGVSSVAPKPTWHLPLHTYSDAGIDLDFGPLLLYDRVVIDASSMEYIASSRRKDLAPLLKSLRSLRDAGYVELRDFHAELERVRPHITSHVERILEKPLPIREPLLDGINGYKQTIPSQLASGVQYDVATLELGFGMHMYIAQSDIPDPAGELRRLNMLMRSSKKRWTKSDLDDVRMIMKPTITYLYQNIALGEMLQMPFLDVSYTSNMYQHIRDRTLQVFSDGTRQAVAEASVAQEIFNCAIPELRPASAIEMLKLLKSNAARDFREYVFDAAARGKVISREEYVSQMRAALGAERSVRKAMSVVSWTERAVSLIPGAGLLATAVSMFAERVIRQRSTKSYRWMYALLEASDARRSKAARTPKARHRETK